MKDFDIVPI